MTEPNDTLDPHHDGEVVVAGVQTAGETADDTAPEVKVSEDGNLVEHGGHKYVREEALVNERQARQKLADTLKQLEPVLPEFEQFLKGRRDRSESTVDRARPQGEPDYTDDELKGFAITRGYYQEDERTPDLPRAQRELDILAGISKRQAKREVEPVARGSRTEAARTNKERAYERKFVDGQPIAGKNYLDLAFQSVGEEMPADENVSNLVQIVAAGLEYLDARKNGRVRPGRGGRGEPMLVEGSAGRFEGDEDGSTALDRAAARARGKTPEQWSKLMKDATSSKAGELEAV